MTWPKRRSVRCYCVPLRNIDDTDEGGSKTGACQEVQDGSAMCKEQRRADLARTPNKCSLAAPKQAYLATPCDGVLKRRGAFQGDYLVEAQLSEVSELGDQLGDA